MHIFRPEHLALLQPAKLLKAPSKEHWCGTEGLPHTAGCLWPTPSKSLVPPMGDSGGGTQWTSQPFPLMFGPGAAQHYGMCGGDSSVLLGWASLRVNGYPWGWMSNTGMDGHPWGWMGVLHHRLHLLGEIGGWESTFVAPGREEPVADPTAGKEGGKG